MTYKAVALDAMGVIYTKGDDLRELLIPFLRTKGCERTDDDLREAYRNCYRGGASVETFWAATGIERARARFEDEYLRLYDLTPGVVQFLVQMQVQGIAVYGLSNDIGVWSVKRRQLHGLDTLFAGWVISSEVKAPKPDERIFRQLTERLQFPPADCVVVDDRVANLDGARAAGLSTTVLFGTTEAPFGHFSAASFEELMSFMSRARGR